jgi:predicted exporter
LHLPLIHGHRFSEMNLRRHWVWLLLIVPVVIGLIRLRFDVDVLNLLPQDSSVVRGLKAYQQNFSNARQLFITVSTPTSESTEVAARTITEKLRQSTNLVGSVVWQPPWLESPTQASELLAYLWLNQPPALFGELTNRLHGANLTNGLHEALERATTSLSPTDIALGGYDPFGLTRLPESASAGAASFGSGNELFASADGTFRMLFVDPATELRTYRDSDSWLKQVKSIVQDLQTNHGLQATIGYTGGPTFVSEIAGGMQHDMTESVLLTAVVIAILFWISHRRWLPMLWLIFLLAVILLCTVALGGLIFGTLNVVSLGFAGILLGLAVDYGVVHYQEAMAKPTATIPEIRRAIRPSITWAAITTTCAFLVLNLGGLPGLGELGTTVAIGIGLSAIVMLFVFLPPLFRDRLKKRQQDIAAGIVHQDEVFLPDPIAPQRRMFAFGTSALILAVGGVILSRGLPQFDHSPDALRPRNSAAYATVEKMKEALGKKEDPLWIIIPGHDETTVAQRLDLAEAALKSAVSNKSIAGFTMPTMIWPRPDNQRANRAAVESLLAEKEVMKAAAVSEGFSTNSLILTENAFATWHRALASTNTFWPTNFMSRWILQNVTARTPEGLLALGLIYPATNGPGGSVTTKAFLENWPVDLRRQRVLLSGWTLLGNDMFLRVEKTFPRVVLPMIGLVLLSLWLAFRRAKEILLSLAVLAVSGVCLLAIMRILGWQWNLMNMMALPLMLGAGVDYSIFTQLALRRHNGNIQASYHAVGRALLLCGGTAVAGFASLAISSNSGMASLGEICAVGIGLNMLISVYILPIWWRAITPHPSEPAHQ